MPTVEQLLRRAPEDAEWEPGRHDASPVLGKRLVRYSKISSLALQPHLVSLKLTVLDRGLLEERSLPRFEGSFRNRRVPHTESLIWSSVDSRHVKRALVNFDWSRGILIAVKPQMDTTTI